MLFYFIKKVKRAVASKLSKNLPCCHDLCKWPGCEPVDLHVTLKKNRFAEDRFAFAAPLFSIGSAKLQPLFHSTKTFFIFSFVFERFFLLRL